jgi:DnaJ-class molecular chaperone
MNLRDLPPIGLVNPEPPEYYYVEEDCPVCEGSGFMSDELCGEVDPCECTRCDGTGYIVIDSRTGKEV